MKTVFHFCLNLGAEGGNRTHVYALRKHCSATELYRLVIKRKVPYRMSFVILLWYFLVLCYNGEMNDIVERVQKLADMIPALRDRL